ncbi:MAG: polyprenol monophosphomannose synthase [Candidatus Zixiibacteriota bacterium]
MTTSNRPLIIFPTYNEKENIERIINAVLGQDDSIEVLVVDDNSPDGTGQIVDKLAAANRRIHILHREKKEGLGRAYIAGFKWAIERKYDYIFEMDADFSHGPDYIPDFLEAIKENDLVIGSRYISGVNVINWPMSRLLLSYFANVYTRIITGLPVRDATGGFKCFRRQALEAIPLDSIKSNGYIFQIEVSLRIWKKGMRLKEIPIVFVDRRLGASKMSKKIVREAIWKVWYLRLMSLLGRLK